MRVRRQLPTLRAAAISAGLATLLGPAASFAVRAQGVRATIDAAETHAPISHHLYGQFLEHIGDIVNDGIWAELLDDRKFFYPVVETEPERAPGRRPGPRRWTTIGEPDRVAMDTQRPFVGRHSPKLVPGGDRPAGFVQAGLAVAAGESYVGRIALAATGDVRVEVTLVWGPASGDRQIVSTAPPAADYFTYPLTFVPAGSTTGARLEITATGLGTVHVGAVSLMPADNLGGFRKEVVEALRSLRSGAYRFPGGNFVSAHEWRNAIGDPDRRPPTWDPVWRAVQPNDVGTDEFILLCRLLDVEPYITVNAGFGDAWSAAQLVEYVNGSALTTMGRLRAANGHPEPYDVRFWGIGNEAWGSWQMGAMSLDQFVIKNNEFAEVMRAVDPSIVLIASGAMPDAMTGSGESQKRTGKIVPEPLGPADWTGGLFLHSLDHMDWISEHYYSYGGTRYDVTRGEQVPVDPDEPLVDWMRRPANHVRLKVEAYEDYEERIPALREKPVPIVIDEWAFAGAPIRPDSYRAVPAYAWAFHEMFRRTDLFVMANFTFATSMVSATRTEAVLNPTGLLFKLYRDHFGTIPVTVTGNSPQSAPKYPVGGEEPNLNAGSPTFPLDVAAAWTEDRSALTIAVINPTESEFPLELGISGAELAGTGTRWRMAPESLDATVSVGRNPEVVVEEKTVTGVPSSVTLPRFSVTIYRLEAK
jgi:alpha-N-arabinofuranosidase